MEMGVRTFYIWSGWKFIVSLLGKDKAHDREVVTFQLKSLLRFSLFIRRFPQRKQSKIYLANLGVMCTSMKNSFRQEKLELMLLFHSIVVAFNSSSSICMQCTSPANLFESSFRSCR